MDSRERILTTLRGGIPDRIGRADSLWSETVQRWKKEGLAEVRKQTNQEIMNILTPEQKKKLQELRSEKQQQKPKQQPMR